MLYSLKSEDSEQFSEPVLQGWTEVRQQTRRQSPISSVGGSSDWRVLAVPCSQRHVRSVGGILIIAMPLKQTNRIGRPRGVLTALVLATLASAIAMTWVIVTRTFEPLARVREQTAAGAAGDLSRDQGLQPQ